MHIDIHIKILEIGHHEYLPNHSFGFKSVHLPISPNKAPIPQSRAANRRQSNSYSIVTASHSGQGTAQHANRFSLSKQKRCPVRERYGDI